MPSKSLAIKSKGSQKRTRDESMEEASSVPSDFEEGSSQDGLSDAELEAKDSGSESDDGDADAPRIAQWEADDDTIYEQTQTPRDASQLSKLENNLRGLPLGTLLKAQKALKQVEPDSESESDSENDSPSEENDSAPPPRQKEQKVEWISRDTKKHARANKHAPMEVTSKRPVSRKRVAVEVPKIVVRDPRFLPTTGEFKEEEYQKSYGFLAQSRKDELKLMREEVSRSRKILSSCPMHLRSEREQEIERLERAVKRMEGLVNRDRQEAIQQKAFANIKHEEKEKQKQGKGQWFLKDSQKREIIQKARFEALSSEGGHRAVKKAIDRKQKKIGEKEKKSRPYARGAGLEDSGSQRRPIPSGSNKRPRFS